MIKRRNFSQGAVSIFMVIFAMLIIAVVTIGFLRLMTMDQRQATSNDLAQSAYDSALAGVEDAKRALIAYQKACDLDSNSCNPALFNNTQSCNSALLGLGVVSAPSGAEVPVQRSGGSARDAALDQAYTCVKITPNTPDYRGSLAADESTLVPLRSVPGTSFDSIRVSWFNSKDVPSGTSTLSLGSSAPGTQTLVPKGSWPENRPSLLRTQFMQISKDGFAMTDFDSKTATGQSNANTLFLYPTTISSASVSVADFDARRSGSNLYPSPASNASAPFASSCSPATLVSGGYACSATLTLPEPVGGGDRTAYLRLVPFFRATHFKVELLSGGSVVEFGGVQPSVDSTGRANDLFRRVEARVNLNAVNFPFPEAAVDVSDNFCKDFTVTPETYISGGCAP